MTTERVEASAPGKIILLGEHAVVYGRPAIALPLNQIRARAVARPGRLQTGMVLHAADIGRRYLLAAAAPDEPMAFTCRNVLRFLQIDRDPDVHLTLRSEIPIASGLGSGAAAAAALAAALSRYLGRDLTAGELSALVYRTESLIHGHASGIDNTVVAYERPIWFVREMPVETIGAGAPLDFLVADTGQRSPTRHTVAGVRARWQEEPLRYEALFDQIGARVHAARDALARGDRVALGQLMTENHHLLQEIGVSSEANDRLVDAALAAGALGAKLSGGGGGGNNLVLVPPERIHEIKEALTAAGAGRVLETRLG